VSLRRCSAADASAVAALVAAAARCALFDDGWCLLQQRGLRLLGLQRCTAWCSRRHAQHSTAQHAVQTALMHAQQPNRRVNEIGKLANLLGAT
jgi:hypothetical protein